MSVYVLHSLSIHLKLTPHCKSTIFQQNFLKKVLNRTLLSNRHIHWNLPPAIICKNLQVNFKQCPLWASQVAQWVKNLPAMQETLEIWVRFWGQEDPLEEGTATHSSILAWRFLWTEEPGKPQSTGCKELNTSEATEHSTAAVSFKKTQQIFTFHCKVCGKQNLSMYVFIY